MRRLENFAEYIRDSMVSWNCPGVVVAIIKGDDVLHQSSLTGESPEEIKLYRFDPDLIGFRMKRNRLDFVRENGAIARLIFKTPDITLEAQKKQ